MRYIIRFSKKGMLRFTSHLDMIRFFKRAFSRAGIVLEHSKGFNPHPKMTFAQPLSLGYTGISEILEIETKEEMDADVLKDALQAQMPEGIRITETALLSEMDKGISGRISEACYKIIISDTEGLTAEDFLGLMERESLVVLKKQKKKKELKEINIRPMIRSIESSESVDKDVSCREEVDNKIIITTVLDCGSVSNLNPELLLKGVSSVTGVEILPENVEIQRLYLK